MATPQLLWRPLVLEWTRALRAEDKVSKTIETSMATPCRSFRGHLHSNVVRSVAANTSEGVEVPSASLQQLSDALLLSAEELAVLVPAEVAIPTLPNGQPEGFAIDDGRFAVLVYSDMRALTTACGAGQPARLVTGTQLAGWVEQAQVDTWFAVDAWHPAGHRYPEPEPLEFEPLPYAERAATSIEFWIPTRPVRAGSDVIQVELFTATPSAPTCLLAYESIDELRACCGPFQDAVSIDPENLDAVLASTGAEAVFFGAEVTEEARHQAPVLDWAAHNLFDPETDPTGRAPKE